MIFTVYVGCTRKYKPEVCHTAQPCEDCAAYHGIIFSSMAQTHSIKFVYDPFQYGKVSSLKYLKFDNAQLKRVSVELELKPELETFC